MANQKMTERKFEKIVLIVTEKAKEHPKDFYKYQKGIFRYPETNSYNGKTFVAMSFDFDDAVRVLTYYLITKPFFNILFERYSFVKLFDDMKFVKDFVKYNTNKKGEFVIKKYSIISEACYMFEEYRVTTWGKGDY